jgi:hygromycin-B 7''-O-kinase
LLKHGLATSELEPYARGETVVWRAGEHVVKLTAPDCHYQIEAEVGCLSAVQGKLSVTTPRLVTHGSLAGWPYVILERIGGRPLEELWTGLDHAEHLRLAQDLARVCRELHALPHTGFPADWRAFWASCRRDVAKRHALLGGPPALLDCIDAFVERLPNVAEHALVPLHTELLDQHLYVEERAGRLELCGLIDFADARLGPALYEHSAIVEFLFKGERGLFRAFSQSYGVPAARLTPEHAQTMLAWHLCHRFGSLARLLSAIAPAEPASLEELAQIVYS